MMSRGKGADMDTYQSHLQEDGTTIPPVTRDTPQPPGVEIPEVPDATMVAPETDDDSSAASSETAAEAPD
jgi:hypothetical protein